MCLNQSKPCPCQTNSGDSNIRCQTCPPHSNLRPQFWLVKTPATRVPDNHNNLHTEDWSFCLSDRQAEGLKEKEKCTDVTWGCMLGTSSISSMTPVQWACWGKSTVTSRPLGLMAAQQQTANKLQ